MLVLITVLTREQQYIRSRDISFCIHRAWYKIFCAMHLSRFPILQKWFLLYYPKGCARVYFHSEYQCGIVIHWDVKFTLSIKIILLNKIKHQLTYVFIIIYIQHNARYWWLQLCFIYVYIVWLYTVDDTR